MSADLSERQAYLILNRLPGLGPVGVRRLLAANGGQPQRLLAGALSSAAGVRPEALAALQGWQEHFNLAREEDRMARSGIRFIIASDPDYPPLLQQIYDPPLGLYCLGRLAAGPVPVAIVGTRRPSAYGRTVAEHLGSELARRGLVVVSGLARGVDSAAHHGALAVSGQTVAVLGTGCDLIYPPENLDLYRRIAGEGALLSEFPLGRRATPSSFAIRNRIVAGMCAAVVVVESAADGGAMITARFAGEQGRVVGAVPGRIDQPMSAGCHQLIRDGATLITGVEDLLSELNYLGATAPLPILAKGLRAPEPVAPLSEDERRILEGLAGGEMLTADALAERTGLGAAQVAAGLLMLELKRCVEKHGDGTYEAVAVASSS